MVFDTSANRKENLTGRAWGTQKAMSATSSWGTIGHWMVQGYGGHWQPWRAAWWKIPKAVTISASWCRDQWLTSGRWLEFCQNSGHGIAIKCSPRKQVKCWHMQTLEKHSQHKSKTKHSKTLQFYEYVLRKCKPHWQCISIISVMGD